MSNDNNNDNTDNIYGNDSYSYNPIVIVVVISIVIIIIREGEWKIITRRTKKNGPSCTHSKRRVRACMRVCLRSSMCVHKRIGAFTSVRACVCTQPDAVAPPPSSSNPIYNDHCRGEGEYSTCDKLLVSSQSRNYSVKSHL